MTRRPRTSLPSLVLNVPAIARRSAADVELLLGAPDSGAGVQVTPHQKVAYRRGTVEVVYVDGKANWIKLYAARDLPFAKTALPKLGLPVVRPTYVSSGTVMSWHNIPNVKEVSIYAGQAGSASSVIVCVETAAQPAKPAKKSRWTRRVFSAA